jgi:hypothetical protein
MIDNPGRYLVLLPPINGETAASAAINSPYFTENPGDPFKAWDVSGTFDCPGSGLRSASRAISVTSTCPIGPVPEELRHLRKATTASRHNTLAWMVQRPDKSSCPQQHRPARRKAVSGPSA